MSARIKKLLGGSDAPLTRLKARWRELSDAERDYWRSLFISSTSQENIRQYLQTQLRVELKYDSQLNAFRDWELDQQELDLEAARAKEEQRRIEEEHPDWTKEQVRQDLLLRYYRRARARGNAELGLKAMAADAKLEGLALERDKFQREHIRLIKTYFEDNRVREILTSAESEDAKTEQLGQRIFGDLWK